MIPDTRRRLDGLLAIGPHRLDAQLRALAAYAARTGHALDVLWAILPGEDAARDAPDSSFPIVVFDDEIAGFSRAEIEMSDADAEPRGVAATDWHVAHPFPHPKRPTSHLPVYGSARDGETAADAVLCVGTESLDRQVARIEAYAMRTGVRIRGVYVASDPVNLRVLLRDFSASNRTLGTGPALTVGPAGSIEVHD
jgi:hypothetical protein